VSDVRKVIDQISDLPTLPDVVARLNQIVTDPNASAGDINDIISRDIALSAKILKLVNSPFYGFPRRITTITYAVVILGFNTVRNLALSAFVFDSFKRKGSKDFDLHGFWRHSICSAIGSQAIARRTRLWQEEEAFMAGLLHGVGKVVMNQHLPKDLSAVMQEVRAKEGRFTEAERAVLDYTQAELGGLLLERWNLPKPIVAATRFCESPDRSQEEAALCAIVHLAVLLSSSLCAGFSGDQRIMRLHPAAWDLLQLSWGDVDQLLTQITDEYNRADAFFEMA